MPVVEHRTPGSCRKEGSSAFRATEVPQVLLRSSSRWGERIRPGGIDESRVRCQPRASGLLHRASGPFFVATRSRSVPKAHQPQVERTPQEPGAMDAGACDFFVKEVREPSLRLQRLPPLRQGARAGRRVAQTYLRALAGPPRHCAQRGHHRRGVHRLVGAPISSGFLLIASKPGSCTRRWRSS